MPLDSKLKTHLHEWMSFEIFDKLTISTSESVNIIIKSLDIIVLNINDKFYKIGEKGSFILKENINQITIEYPNLKDQFLSFLEYITDPSSFFGVETSDYDEFYSLIKNAITLKKTALKKHFSESSRTFYIKELLEQLETIKKLFLTEDLKIPEIIKKIEKYLSSLKIERNKIIAHLFLDPIQSTFVLIPKKNNKFDKNSLKLLILSLENELLKIGLDKMSVYEINLNYIINNCIKTISAEWFLEKASKLNADPSKSQSIYPNPILAEIKTTINVHDPLEVTQFETLLDNINLELAEFNSNNSTTLNLILTKHIQEALLTKQLSIPEVVLTPRHLLEELRQIFSSDSPNLSNAATLLQPLVTAQAFGFTKLLLDLNVKTQVINSSTGESLLQTACATHNSLNTVKLLLQRGALVNHQDNKKNTAAHFLFSNIKKIMDRPEGEVNKILEGLIEYEANLNLQNEDGNTILHLVLLGLQKYGFNMCKTITQLLIILGADTTLENTNKETALTIASKLNDKEIYELIVNTQKSSNQKSLTPQYQHEIKEIKEIKESKENKELKEQEKKSREEKKNKEKDEMNSNNNSINNSNQDILAINDIEIVIENAANIIQSSNQNGNQNSNQNGNQNGNQNANQNVNPASNNNNINRDEEDDLENGINLSKIFRI